MNKKEKSIKININESSEEKSNNESNNFNDEDSIDTSDIDKEHLTFIDLVQKFKEKIAERKNYSLFLEKKRINPNAIIKFDSSTKTILNQFCPPFEYNINNINNIKEIESVESDKTKILIKPGMTELINPKMVNDSPFFIFDNEMNTNSGIEIKEENVNKNKNNKKHKVTGYNKKRKNK